MINYTKTLNGYVLTKDHEAFTYISPSTEAVSDKVYHSYTGFIRISAGFEWDGATGAIDTPDFMRASLVHDALYHLLREGALGMGHRKRCDQLFRDICIEDGMPLYRAWRAYLGVRVFGGRALK